MQLHFKLLFLLACLLVGNMLDAQNNKTALLGRWEVITYAEEGIAVDKKKPALPQAVAVYNALKAHRAHQWYGYTEYDDYTRRESRAFQHWVEMDSTIEVRRLSKAIETPYFVVFFPDSTMSHYNKDSATDRVFFPEAHHYNFAPASMSLDIAPALGPAFYGKTDVQILELSDTTLVLYIPDTAERVSLIKTAYTLP